MASALDELRRGPQLDDPARRFGDLPASDFRLPSEVAASEASLDALPDTQQARVNRFKAGDLADRGIPSYRNEHGDVAPVVDETGAALNAYDSRNNIAYDSKGQPKTISYGETGGPILKDAFADIPAVTDPKTGNIEKRGRGGLYQFVGQDPVIAQAALQAEKDKQTRKEAALIGRKLTLDEHDLTTGKAERKAIATDLQKQVPTLIDPKYEHADQETILKAIDEHFNGEYASPDANEKAGWFGRGDFSPTAQARRDDIDQRKAQAVESAASLFELSDRLNTLHETVGASRETERAQIETLLAHQRGEKGPLDKASSDAGAQGPAKGLYPPEADQARMLGGQPLEPDKAFPALGAAKPVKVNATPVADLNTPFGENDPKSYRVGEDKSFHLDPNNMMKGLRQGIADGIVDAEKAKTLTPQIRQVQDAINEQRKIIDDSGGSKVAAVAHGATLGAAFAAAYPAGAAVGAEVGALGGPAAAVTVPVGAIVGGLITGSLSAYGAKKLVDRLAQSNDTIRTIADAAEMHPYYDAAGNLLSLGAGIPKAAAEGLAGIAAKTGSKAAQSIAESYVNSSGGLYRTVTNLAEDASIRKAGGASAATVAKALAARIGGAAATNVAIDTAINEGAKALGFQKEGETIPSAVQAAILGAFMAGHGIGFKTYQPHEMADILVRAKGAMNEGKDINTVLNPRESEAFDAFSTELKRKINTGEIPVDTEAVTGIVRQALQGGKPYGVSAADIIGKGGSKGLPEGPTAPTAPKGPTKPVPVEPKEKPATATEVTTAKPKVEEKAPVSGPVEPSTPQPSKKTGPNAQLAEAEKRFMDEGGHADKLDAQQKLKALRQAFPDPAARIAQIEEHLSISSTSSEAAKSEPTTPKASVDAGAHEAATSPTNGLAEPTPAQKEAGNYQKGHVQVGGLDISVENPAGTKRQPGFAPLVSHYGYIKGTVGADKDHVDIFIKQGTPLNYSGPVFVVNQHNQTGKFDEHKAVIGARDMAEAKSEYNANYEKGWTGGKSVVEFKDPAAFKAWATNGTKGQPALDPRLATTVGRMAADLGLTYDGKDPESGKHLFHDTSQARATTFTVTPDTVASVEAKALRAKTEEVRARMKGTPAQQAQAAEIAKRKAEREAKSNEQDSKSTQGAAEKEPAQVGQSGASEPGKLPAERGTAELSKAAGESKVRLDKSKQVHADEIAHLGVNHIERVLGKSGIAVERDGSGIAVDHQALAESAKIVEGRGGDSQAWLEDAHKEELIHYRDLLASGHIFNLIHSKIWSALPGEVKAEVRAIYPDSTKADNLVAEYVRMVAQYRETGRITEGHFRDVSRIEMFLKAQQPEALERLLKSMAALTAAEKASTDASKKLSKREQRTEALTERLGAIEGVKPADKAVIETLLRSPNGRALDQAETRIVKLENQNATTSGEQQGSQKGELSRVPPGADVRPHEGEVRKETSGQAGSGSGVEQRPAASEPAGRTETQASQELIDKGKAAFEGLFAALPRYEGQVATKSAKVSEGDVEQLRANNEERLRDKSTPYVPPTSEPLGAALPIKQLPIPKDKRAPMFDLIDAMEKEGITTPEKVAGYLEAISGGKARPFSQSLWDMMAAAGAVERGTHDWPTIYSMPPKASSDALPLPQGWTAAVGKTKTKEGHTYEAEVDWPNKRIVFSKDEHMRNPEIWNHELAHVVIETLPDGPREALYAEYNTAKNFTTDKDKYWSHEQIAMDAGNYLAKPESIEPAIRAIFDRYIKGGKPSTEIKPQNAVQLSQSIAQKLQTGPVTRRQLTDLASETGLTVKAIDEAAELGIVVRARELARSSMGTPEERFDSLVELYDRQPNLTAKTSTSKVNQAYSTPAPLAFAASQLAGITDSTTVYEPTAGNGILLIGANPKRTLANELDPARAASLKTQGFDPHLEDATKFDPVQAGRFNNDFGQVDRVIANPPFGRVITDDQTKMEWPLVGTDETTKEIDQAISMKALSAMRDDGRAVLILGGKNKLLKGDARAQAYASKDQVRFWKPLYEQYRVVDHFTVSGDLYAKQGAGWPVDVIVIAGRGKSPIQLPSADGPRILSSWDELKAELGRSDADRIEAGRYDVEKDRERVGDIIGAIRGVAGSEPAPGSEERPERPATTDGGTRSGADLARPDTGQQPVVSGRPGASEVSGPGEPRPVGVGTTPGSTEQSGQQLSLAEGFRVPYTPASKLPSFKIFVPANMQVPAREALASLEAEVGPIDAYVREKLGYREDAPLESYFSAEQMDALALGVNAIENKTAFVLGDQGGVGKGRVAAGMMAYAIHQGKLPIFITKDVKLYAAMIEDLHDIGKDDITPLFTDNDVAFVDYAEHKWKQGNMRDVMKEIARSGKLHGADALFTTYSQIQTDLPSKYSASKAERASLKAGHTPPPDGVRMEALKRLAPGSVIIADESHLAAGDSIRAWRLGPLLAKAHGVYYSSATFAKRPDSMGIYSRTSLSHATSSTEELIDAMRQGGVPLQQVVSATLAADGLYLRRERDFSKAVFKTHINLDTKERDTFLADNYTDGLRSILSISNKMAEARKLINRIIRKEGKSMHVDNAPRVETTNFASKLHNLISQYLFAIKAEATVRRVVEGVTKGFTNADGITVPHKVIVAFQNTMEQPILALQRSSRPLTFNGMLLHYLDSQRTLTSGRGANQQKMVITDEPDPEFESYSDNSLQKIIIVSRPTPEDPKAAGVNEKALAELFRRIMSGVFKDVEAKIEKLDLADMPLSPIDHVRRQLTLAGIKNEEITKRGTGIDEDGAIYSLHPSSNTKAAHLRYLTAFNNEDTDGLLINASGSTGISAHSSSKFKRTDPRAMIIVQPHLDINEFMQTTYRIDRTGQVHQPYYELLQTAIPAELRPAAILGKKMASLNANTTSNAESEISEGNKGTDIFNQYGDEVVYNYLKSDPTFLAMLDMPKIVDSDGNFLPIEDVMSLYENDGQFAAAVTGRAAVLPTSEQEIFWEKVMADYIAHINYLNELGENELVSDTVDLKAETLETKELTPAVTMPGKKSGFDAASQMEKIRADIGLKPLQATEVVKMMGELDENTLTSQWRASSDAWKSKELARLQEKVGGWDDVKKASYDARWREQEEEIVASLNLVGRGLHLKTEKGLDGYGAITDVKLDEEHPLTPSKQIFTVHVNTTKKQIRVPASQLPTIARIAAGNFEDVYEATAERSNQRYMVTGNLLAAYLAIKDSAPTAKIVQYTTDKGDLRQGILMPAKFSPGMLAKKRVVESAKHMLELLQAGRSLTNAGSEVTVVKAPSGGFVLRVPSSKVMGGAYWRDSQLAKLMEGGQFVERGGAMIGKFGYDNSHLIYQRLLDLQATLFYTDAPEEPLGAARPIRAATAFKDDVEKVAKEIGMTAKESYRLLQHLVSPTTGVAMDAHDQVMRMLGERNQKGYQTDRVLEASRDAFDKMPRPEQITFIDRMKTGEVQATPELQQVAEALRKIDTESWQAARDAYAAMGFKDKEIPLKWLENHYRVLWKKIPGSTDDEKAAWIGKARRGLRGSMGQHKQHTLDTMSDGLDMGGIPYSYNPVEMFKLAHVDLWKLTSTLKTWKWAKDNGFVEFVRGAFPKAPDGMVQLNDSIANVYFPADSGEGLIHAGKYFVEEGFGRLLNNYLSKDYIRQAKIGRGLMWLKNFTTSIELSISPFHAIFETLEAVGSSIGHGLTKLANRGIRSALKGDFGPTASALHDMTIGALGSPVTGFNLGRQIQIAAIDPVAYFKTADGQKLEKTYPGARQAINALWAGGWKPNQLEQDWKNKSIRTFVEAVSDIKAGTSDNYIMAGIRALPALNEWVMKPLFDHYIPNLKVAQFFKEFLEAKIQNERKLKGGVLTDAALARQVWRFVEDRFGEMNFDSLFWNSNFKTAMQLMFRSVTWKLGSLEAFAGAFAGQGKEFRDAFKERRAPELHRNMAWLFGMFLLTATLGAVISIVLGEKKPKNLVDFVFPQIDPKDDKVRVSLPTYFKDLVHLIHSPTSYVTASMSGWIGRVADLLRNKDYYGVQIRDTDDPIVKQALAVGKYTAQTLQPFSIRGYKNLSAQDVTGLRKTLALLAINPAPRHISQSPAEEASEEYWRGARSEAGVRPEQFESKLAKRKLVTEIEHGKAPNISAALAAGTIKPADVKSLYQRAQMGPLASQVLHMPLAEAERIFEKASPEEKRHLTPIMLKKRLNSSRRQKKLFQGF